MNKKQTEREPIAIVGMGVRLPGGASDADGLWRLLVEGRDAITQIPPSRFDVDRLFDETPATPGKIGTRWGGFVDGLELFDAEFFSVSPREAERLDPQQRLLLECAWDALEDAGHAPSSLAGTHAGVYIGMWINEYESRLFRNEEGIDFYMTTGSGRYAASGRLSYVFGFQGPSLTVDTGCSSSLVTVHLACQSLWTGETELALAGGANAIVEPFVSIAYSQSQMLAPDGRCKFGDARGNGYVRSDGAGIVVLKRLSRAIADGDRIYATILGSSVTNDGKSSGFLTTPGQGGQEEMLRRAYASAGISPGRVHYVEAHGTGTRAGDPVELKALGAVLADGRPADRPCRVGSIKTNIGHTEGAAGIAGLIKAALCVRHRTVPKSLHFETPNPEIPWAEIPLVIPTETEPWPAGEPAIAGVNSFGIAGTNAHVVLGEAPAAERAHVTAAAEPRPVLLAISGHTPAALTEMTRRYRDAVAAADEAALADLCYAAAARREQHAHRTAVAAKDKAALVERLDTLASGDVAEGATVAEILPRRKVVFVFPGQGSQWVGMGRRLYATEPAFWAALDECDAAIAEFTGWSVVDELMAPPERSRLSQIDVVQPALCAVEIALAALWRAWGVEPDAVVGHSMGEVAAAYVAGAISIRDAARIICTRSALMRRVSGTGAMALVGLSRERAEAELRGLEQQLSVAVCNSARSTVVSGDRAALNTLLERLEEAEVFCRPVKVDVASHSPHMDPLRPELVEALAPIAPRAASVPMYSTVRAGVVDGAQLGPEYWGDNLRRPVLFGATVQQLLADGCTTFIEMSPHPILGPAVREVMDDAGATGVSVGSTRREEDERLAMLASLGVVYAAGHDINWAAVYPGLRQRVALPPYAYQRERFWFERPSDGGSRRANADVARHPLVGVPQPLATDAQEIAWFVDLSSGATSWLRSHRLHGSPVCAASLYIELVTGAVSQLGPAVAVRIDDLVFRRVLRLDGDAGDVQIVAAPEGAGRYAISVRSRHAGQWVLNATCTASLEQAAVAAGAGEPGCQGAVEPGCQGARVPGCQGARVPGCQGARVPGCQGARVPGCQGARVPGCQPADVYERLSAAGADMLPALRALASVESEGASASAGVTSDSRRFLESGYRTDPVALDACFQLATWADLSARGDAAPLAAPSSIDMVRVSLGSEAPARVECELAGADALGGRNARVVLRSEAGAVLAEVAGLRFPAVAHAAAAPARPVDGWLHPIEWEAAPLAAADAASIAPATWLIVHGGGALATPLADALVHARQQVILQNNPALAASALTGRRIDRVVWLAADVAAGDAPAGPAVGSLDAFLELVKAMSAAKGAPKIHVITSGAQVAASHPAQATFWGLCRVLAEEHPDWWGGIVDADPDAPAADSAAALGRELLVGGSEAQVAYRGSTRLTPRFGTLAAKPGAPRLRPDGAYLITGGLGELGLRLASWLVERGARWLVLAGRTPLPPRAEWARVAGGAAARRIDAIRGLERLGAHVHLAALDVADGAALDAFLASYENDAWPAIRGVFHCAGVVDDRLLAHLDGESLARVLRPKVDGASQLDRAFRSRRLDCFVMFSSIGALVGQVGQGSYAAANAFLDALASARRAQGLPALSINWGGWAEIGFAGTEGGRQTLAELDAVGVGTFTADEAFDGLGRALLADAAQLAFFPPDWSRYAATSRRRNRIAAPAVRVEAASSTPDAERTSVVDRLLAMPAAERQLHLQQHLVEQLSAVLRKPAARLDVERPMVSMGLDSLMSVEYRRRLEGSLGVALPATVVWNYPTIERLAAHIDGRLTPAAPPAAEPVEAAAPAEPAADASELDDLLAVIEGLSEEDARQLLALDRPGEPNV